MCLQAKKVFTLTKIFIKIIQHLPSCAEIAQMVEQRTENPRVDGSIPPLGI
jgi:hypothetical protein